MNCQIVQLLQQEMTGIEEDVRARMVIRRHRKEAVERDAIVQIFARDASS